MKVRYRGILYTVGNEYNGIVDLYIDKRFAMAVKRTKSGFRKL